MFVILDTLSAMNQGLEEDDTERLVVGSNGDIYYTPDHYRTFVLLKGL